MVGVRVVQVLVVAAHQAPVRDHFLLRHLIDSRTCNLHMEQQGPVALEAALHPQTPVDGLPQAPDHPPPTEAVVSMAVAQEHRMVPVVDHHWDSRHSSFP